MKLIAKEQRTSEEKGRAAKAKRSAVGPAAPARPKRPELPKKADVPKKAAKKSGESDKAFLDVARNYLREVVVELKKVVWPSRKETLSSTGVILVIVGLSALYLGFVDLLLGKLLHLLVH